jgi:hypothetical protein
MMNKSLRARTPESSRKRIYGFQRLFRNSCERCGNFELAPMGGIGKAKEGKKRAAVSGGF